MVTEVCFAESSCGADAPVPAAAILAPPDSAQPSSADPTMDILNLLTRLLLWLGIGYFLWWILRKFIPANFLTWFGGAMILALIAAAFLFPDDSTIGVFWQFLAFPLTPLGATITLLALSLGGDFKKQGPRLVTVALLILLFSSMPLIARALVNHSEQSVQRAYLSQRRLCSDICPAIDQVPIDRAVSLVVIGENADAYRLTNALSSRIDADSPLDPALVARLNSTANIYNRISAARPFVTVTAGPRYGSPEEQEPLRQAIRQQLTGRGVPAESIRVQNTGTDIRAAVVDQEAFLSEQGLFSAPARSGPFDTDRNNRTANRVVLVAPALTMRRAALAFENEGLQVVAAPTELYSTPGQTGRDTLARLADLVPDVNALALTSRYWNELLSAFYYYLRGWLPPFSMQWEQVVETLP
ncbi:YdcF family protein [Nodosilinea sp. LEGE 06152]|uniref:YdcF family protein n=1 Tax=Nodosilinea sp. LEGE 06152 TaxID=2777966 RepID=UPI00188237A6|nr:ElyC/SanA/YdcF family protein [Nodosilinea sp. LEGE 06152]MBE9156529.1 YdcF family protein [Nodosilinea sp. LEGE 06152]